MVVKPTRRELLQTTGVALVTGACQSFSSASRSSGARWIWSGGVTPSGFRVVGRIKGASKGSLRITTASGFQADVAPDSASSDGTFHFEVTGLEPDVRYQYALVTDVDEALVGSVRTFPPEGPASFVFCAGSCAQTGSDHLVFETVKRHDPLVFLHLGDAHYEDIAEDHIGRFRSAYDRVLGSVRQSMLYRHVPVAYVWDDHDFGANNSDRGSPSRPVAQSAYREHVPSYPLVERGAIYHAFTIGRVRFLMTDCRSERTPPKLPHRYRTLLGAKQKAWLKNELLEAKGRYALTVWVSSVGWIGTELDGDSWPGYLAERAELSMFMTEHGVHNVMMLCGDAHMLAIDDGRNNQYAQFGGPGFPVFHVAALDQTESTKGGPYSVGVEAGRGQFGRIAIDDRVHEVNVTLSGRNADDEELLVHRFTVPG